jgi:hypothetical protein
MRPRTLILAFSLLLLLAPAAHAKSYSADRYDARITVRPGGALEVTETVVFRFDGTFREVFRRIPRRRTDGIQVTRVAMDGADFSQGRRPGQYDLSNDDGLRVRWHFAPVTSSTHTFELTYVARGVVQQSPDGDLLEWRALPSNHDYRIETATVDFDLPAAPARPPAIQTSRTSAADVRHEDTHIRLSASGIRSHGWIEASILMPAGSAITAPPDWQARRIYAARFASQWLIAGALVFAAGMMVLFALRQGYDSPPQDSGVGPTGPEVPDASPPAIAGAVVSNGRVGLEQAMATLFALAERGELSIVENPKHWGQRSFELRRTPTAHPLTEYEQAVLDAAFTGRETEQRTDLTRVRGRLTRRLRRFTAAVERQMLAGGLIDEGRLAVRKRFAGIGAAALILGALMMIPAAVLVRNYGAWPFAVPGAVMVVGLIGLIMHAAHTPLSNEGIRRGREWRGFQQFLRQVTRDRVTVPRGSAARMLPFAVATGLASGWSSYLKKHNEDVPPWFRALASDHGGQAFAYFVATGGSGASHGAAAGAAGGGASGAH